MKLAKFLDLEPPRRGGGGDGGDASPVEAWRVTRHQTDVLDTFLADHAPLFPQAVDVAPDGDGDGAGGGGGARRLLACPWNDLLVRDGVGADGRDGWRFSRARRSNAGAAWARAWESPPPPAPPEAAHDAA